MRQGPPKTLIKRSGSGRFARGSRSTEILWQRTVLAKAYAEIAKRHLQAADLAVRNGLNEIATFHCYHAFESIACAAIAHQTKPIPRTHGGKVNKFVAMYRAHPFARGAAAVAAIVVPLRNRALYPEIAPTVAAPATLFTSHEAQRLVKRVDGVVKAISSALGL